jgi:surface antigen
MKTILSRVLLALAIIAAPPLAWCFSGWEQMLSEGPGEHFNDEDVRLLRDAFRKTVEAPGPAQQTEWRNPETGSGGTMLVVGERAEKGFDACRRVRVALYSKKRQGKPFVWTACKDQAGAWRLVSAG